MSTALFLKVLDACCNTLEYLDPQRSSTREPEPKALNSLTGGWSGGTYDQGLSMPKPSLYHSPCMAYTRLRSLDYSSDVFSGKSQYPPAIGLVLGSRLQILRRPNRTKEISLDSPATRFRV